MRHISDWAIREASQRLIDESRGIYRRNRPSTMRRIELDNETIERALRTAAKAVLG